MKQANNYLRCWSSCVIGLLLLVAGFNWFVNPFSIFNAPAIPHFNANKPDYASHLRLTHVYRVENLRPNCVFLGTSRAGRGLSPNHPLLANLNCYNMALPSASMYQLRRGFQHAQAINPQKLVILTLDLRVFHPETDTSGAFSDMRLAVDENGEKQFNLFSARLPDMASSLISVSALQASLTTIRKQSWVKDTLATNGFWLPLTDEFDHVKTFDFYTRTYVGQFKEMRQNSTGFQKSLDEFRLLLREAHTQNVELKLIIHPAHAWQWQTLLLSDLWSRFETMKYQMVEINAQEASWANQQPYPIWDFSGSYGPSLEPVPTKQGELMHWFWEPAHYKQVLGDLILDRVLGEKPPTDAAFADFGARLDNGGLEIHLTKLRGLQDIYAAGHPIDMAKIQSIVNETQNSANNANTVTGF
ncbi:hypothetical protein [Methylomonas albis]|uniref:Uncharacterized protein n=1 Tax=Methylomonas albis TaxID=1854563 RepID=A0ABR9CYD7_9GAMM|nr:hypothetical protein [Methylomonas albis]MBD9355705.1 hypothetical protein [Methylomonas albis]